MTADTREHLSNSCKEGWPLLPVVGETELDAVQDCSDGGLYAWYEEAKKEVFQQRDVAEEALNEPGREFNSYEGDSFSFIGRIRNLEDEMYFRGV